MSKDRQISDRVRTDGGTARGTGYGGGESLSNWAAFGVATYLVATLGTVITVYLGMFLADALGGGGGGNADSMSLLSGGPLEISLFAGFILLVVLGAVIAAGIGILIGRDASPGESIPAQGAVSAGAGMLVAMLVMIVLMALVGGGTGGAGGTGDIAGLIGVLVGLTVGVAATGAAAAAVGARSIS